jgi:hypothetical protein
MTQIFVMVHVSKACKKCVLNVTKCYGQSYVVKSFYNSKAHSEKANMVLAPVNLRSVPSIPSGPITVFDFCGAMHREVRMRSLIGTCKECEMYT